MIKDKNIKNIISTKNAILEALNSNVKIFNIYIPKDNQDNDLNNIVNKAKNKGIRINYLNKDELSKFTNDKRTQNIFAEIEEYKYYEIDDILEYASSKNEKPFIIILDEIEDPYNLGSIIRTAVASGCHGMIIKNRDACKVNNTVIKISSGTAFNIRIALVNNISKSIEYLKSQGLWIVGSDMDGTNMYETDLKGTTCLVMGNEGKGISKLVREKCDYICSIPMFGKAESLNVSNATSIMIYEIIRQNKYATTK